MHTGAFFSPTVVSSLWRSGKREEKVTPGTGASDPDTSRLGKKEEERKADSELSFISSPAGSGRARNVLTTATGRDATELKGFREDLAPFHSAEDHIYRDVVAPAKMLSWKSLAGVTYALFNILETFWSEAYQLFLTQAAEVSHTVRAWFH